MKNDLAEVLKKCKEIAASFLIVAEKMGMKELDLARLKKKLRKLYDD